MPGTLVRLAPAMLNSAGEWGVGWGLGDLLSLLWILLECEKGMKCRRPFPLIQADEPFSVPSPSFVEIPNNKQIAPPFPAGRSACCWVFPYGWITSRSV